MKKSSRFSSNNTNKLSPQERHDKDVGNYDVQIIQINLVLKNRPAISNIESGFK